MNSQMRIVSGSLSIAPALHPIQRDAGASINVTERQGWDPFSEKIQVMVMDAMVLERDMETQQKWHLHWIYNNKNVIGNHDVDLVGSSNDSAAFAFSSVFMFV